MILDNETTFVSNGGQNSITLTSDNEGNDHVGDIFLISLEILNDGDIEETWFEGVEKRDELNSCESKSKLRSFIIKARGTAERKINFISSVGSVVKVRVIRISRTLRNIFDVNSCEICKKLVAAVLRHALAAVGIPTLGELEQELVASFTEFVVDTVELILNDLDAQLDYIQNILAHLQMIIHEQIGNLIDLQNRCSSAVCATLNHC